MRKKRGDPDILFVLNVNYAVLLNASHYSCLSLSLPPRDDTSGEDGEDKDPPVAVKGRRTANSRGHRKGRITRSMANEQDESSSPPLSGELGQYSHVNARPAVVESLRHARIPATYVLKPAPPRQCGENPSSRYVNAIYTHHPRI